jgi:hypothetical protein
VKQFCLLGCIIIIVQVFLKTDAAFDEGRVF